MPYTAAEKARIIEQFQSECRHNLEQLRLEADNISRVAEQKVLRRLNGVSVTLWNVRIRDVLKVERHKKPAIKSLLQDVRALKEGALQEASSHLEGSFLGSLSSDKDRSGRVEKPRRMRMN